MDGRKPSTSANNYGFLASHNGPSGNARKGTSAMIATPTPPSPSDKETGCGIKRALSRRCRKGFSCFMNVNTVKVSSGEGLDVSRPTNVAHVTHVGFDDRTGEYTGLPQEWKQVLSQGPMPVLRPVSQNDKDLEPTSKRRSRRFSRGY